MEKTTMEKMTRIKALKTFFDNPPLSNREVMDLSREERQELAELVAIELKVELVEAS